MVRMNSWSTYIIWDMNWALYHHFTSRTVFQKYILKKIKQYIGIWYIRFIKTVEEKTRWILNCTVLWAVDIFSSERLTSLKIMNWQIGCLYFYGSMICHLSVQNNCLHLQIFPIYFDTKKSYVYRLFSGCVGSSHGLLNRCPYCPCSSPVKYGQ